MKLKLFTLLALLVFITAVPAHARTWQTPMPTGFATPAPEQDTSVETPAHFSEIQPLTTCNRLENGAESPYIQAPIPQQLPDFFQLPTHLRQVPVLVYHHILPDASNFHFRDNPYTIAAEMFELQMQYLADNGFTPITLTELENFLLFGQPLPPRAVKIHFDDGYLSNFVYAYPILARHGFRATVFMITSTMQRYFAFQPPMEHSRLVHTSPLTAREHHAVFETASHSHDMHRTVPGGNRTVFAAEPFASVLNDIQQSLGFVTNRRAIAYPHGQYSQAAVDAARTAGMTMGFTTRAGNVTATCSHFSLPRFTIHRHTPFDQFIRIVEGAR